MYITDSKELHKLYVAAKQDAQVWRKNYPEYERLADNELISDLDENLPEVNDGTLAAALFKLPKRIINSKLSGRVRALDRDDAWLTELANLQWEKEILPRANSQAPFHRKWKDAVRKAAIYGSVPLVTLFIDRGSEENDESGADFIVAQPQDVTLESGKVSDYDSDIIFWDIYYTDIQLDNIIEQAEKENKEKSDGYNKWNIKALKDIRAAKQKNERDSQDEHSQKQNKAVDKSGYHFYVAFQRGVESPFYMCHGGTKQIIREWSNPDPTGDIPVHLLYCYQDFINPYGIGIVKLAGGTQNTLDYMRQADILSTQLGLRPPISIGGDVDSADLDTIIYAQDQQWIVGNATVKREEMSNQIYAQLPNRISMYKISLNQLIPTGDTSIAAGAGDQDYSKTPQGVKFQAQNLSIDDEDFKDNVYMTYEAVVSSMINIHFANKQGADLMKLDDDERKLLATSGLKFPVDEMGVPSNELEMAWDEARAKFKFTVDAEADKAKDEEKRMKGLELAVTLLKDPATVQLLASGQPIIMGNKRLDPGELVGEILGIATDNDKILVDVTSEELQQQEQVQEEQAMLEEQAALGTQAEPQTDEEYIQFVMQQYGVDQPTAMAALEAERQGFSTEEIVGALQRASGGVNVG